MGIVIAMPIAWFNLRGHLAGALQSESRGGTASRAAQRLLLTSAHTMAEGAGAVALAGLWSVRVRYAGKRVGVICSGGNASEAELIEVLRG